jgi:tetratricopeptide (TPR) repeat protein
MDSIPHYWAFLSHSSDDRAAAIWLQRALETYRIPRRLVGRQMPAGITPQQFKPIFRDGTELAADPDLVASIVGALEQSAYLIVLCSPRAAASHWVDKEIVRFRELHGPRRILAVLLEGSVRRDAQDCFPPALVWRSASTEGHERLEPIAADLRPGGDGRRRATLKLLAGMLGVGLDELVRRDAQRRLRWWMAVTAASLIALAITGALATAALFARNDAQGQRVHAEGLIEFMLTDLRKQLEPVGRLDAMDGVGREALKYYEAQIPSRLDAQSLSRRARALRLMGEIRVQRGDLDDAMRDFDDASATTEELLKRSPEDGNRVFDQAQSVFWVGEIARQRGDLTKAESSFQLYRNLAAQLSVLDAHNDDWREETAYAESALGVLFLGEGRTADATASFSRSLRVADELAHRHPDDTNLQLELAQAHAWLADATFRSGRLTETRTHRETELAIYRIVLGKDASLRQPRYSTIVVLQTLGRLASLAGDMDTAKLQFHESADRAEALLSGETENMDTTAVAAIAHVALGEVLLTQGRADEARIENRRAKTLLTRALAHDGRVADWRHYSDESTMLEAKISASSGNVMEALKIDEFLFASLSALPLPAPNTQAFWLLQRARIQTGDDLAAMGRLQDARQQWSGVTDSLGGPLETYEPRLLESLAEAQKRLGMSVKAQTVSDRLHRLFRSVPDNPTARAPEP